jgi:hypothetical protein
MQNEKIKFKPLHEGVGFHPFSEGLPYAPQTKSEPKPRVQSQPTPSESIRHNPSVGATSAGIPSFSIPSMPKTTRQLREQKNPLPQFNPSASVAPKAATIPGKNFEAYREADLRTRFFAYLLDTVVHLSFWTAISMIATFGMKLEIDGTLIAQNWMGFGLFFVFSQWFFIAMQETLFETTFGKSFFKLEFKRNRKNWFSGSLFVRSIVFMIGALTLVGFFFRPQDHFAEVQHQQS